MKESWNTKCPTIARAAQNLVSNAKRFRKEGWGRPAIENDEVSSDIPPKRPRHKTS